MYSVEVYPGRALTQAELATLGTRYQPDDNGLRRGTLRLAASSPQMAATAALGVMREEVGVEAVVEVQPRVTWAGPLTE